MRGKQKADKHEILAQVATFYYKQGMGQKEILEHKGFKQQMKAIGLSPNDPGAISRLLREARELGVIVFDIDSSFAIVGRKNEPLSEKLSSSGGFDLDHSIVIDLPTKLLDSHAQDDRLHTALANQAGDDLRTRIQAGGDHIAVAGGRAVYQTVRVIRRRPPFRKRVQISPLSGRMWTHAWEVDGPHIKRPLDADDAAFVLALAFDQQEGTRFTQISHPLFASDGPQATSYMKEFCPFLPDGTWRNVEGREHTTPRCAIVGVGVVHPNSRHRLTDWETGKDPYLSRAAFDVEHAIKNVKAPVPFFGDVANRLFAALPLPDKIDVQQLEELDKAYDQMLENHLKKLNERMVVVNWRHLQSIERVVAVAGGPLKLEALWTLLLRTKLVEHSRERIITELTTDVQTAKNLLDALDAYERAVPAIKDWYSKMVKRVFAC